MNTWESLTLPMEVLTFALLAAISGAIVSGLVLLTARLLQRRSAPLRYAVLLGGVFGLLAIPALVGVGLNAPITLMPAGEEIVKVSPEMLPALLEPAREDDAPALQDTASSVNDAVGTLLVVAWASIVFVGIARLLHGLWKQRRAIIGQPWNPEWWTDEPRACLAEKVGLKRFPEVHCSPMAPMPMVVGLIRPLIVLPEQAPATWGRAQWEAVLLHEAAHIARRDPWANLAQCLAVILFWWCPFVHLMARRLNDLREEICDNYALEGPCDRLAYAELLVESAERLVNLRAVPVPVGLIDSAHGGLEERITRLLAKEKEPMKKLSFAGKVLGAGLLVAACLSIPAATAFCQTPAAKKVQIKLIVDGKEIDVNAADLAALLQAMQAKPKVPPLPEKPGDAPKVKIILDAVPGPQTKPAPPKPDPRVEELVRQAEAIKPGAGAEIRRALQGPSAADYQRLIEYKATFAPHGTVQLKPGAAHVDNVPGKHVIILTVDANGKVLQLQGAELKKFLEKATTGGGANYELRFDSKPGDPKAKAEAMEIEGHLELMKALQKLHTTPVPAPPKTPAPATKPTPPSAPDVEALARQIDRLKAELDELRKRVDQGKK